MPSIPSVATLIRPDSRTSTVSSRSNDEATTGQMTAREFLAERRRQPSKLSLNEKATETAIEKSPVVVDFDDDDKDKYKEQEYNYKLDAILNKDEDDPRDNDASPPFSIIASSAGVTKTKSTHVVFLFTVL
jgi:hypothetical protein